MAQHSIHYPEIGFDYYGHHALQTALERSESDELARMEDSLNALDGTVVISSENFSRCSQKAVEALAMMAKCDKVRIIYYQRNVLDMIYVWWQEIVKHGSTKTLLSYYAECMTRPYSQHVLNPKMIIDRWARVFGGNAVTIYRYDEINNVANQFVNEVLGLSGYTNNTTNIEINKSFDAASTEFIRCVNACGISGVRSLIEDAEAKLLRDQLRNAISGRLGALAIDFDCFVFGRIEREFEASWAHRIDGFKKGKPLFSKRSSVLNYIDSPFWFTERVLAEQIEAYSATRSAKIAAEPII
jgi:hypothetical protein